MLADVEKAVPDDFGPFYQAGRVLLTLGKLKSDFEDAKKDLKRLRSS